MLGEIKYITYLLAEIKADIKSFEKVTNTKLDNLSAEIATLKTDTAVLTIKVESQQKTLETQQVFLNKIPELAEKVGELKTSDR
jgi:hypothetical protein